MRRPAVVARFPIHVCLKVKREIGSLRTAPCHNAICDALAAAQRDGFRVCHYTVEGHHLHFVVEAKNQPALSRGMQGLVIRMARKLNRTLGRTGKLFADRYFARVLKTPREVRDCLAYVLCNHQRHAFGKGPGWRKVGFDTYSSAATFDGWRVHVPAREPNPREPVVANARTWLLRAGWRRHGLLMPAYVPQWGNNWGERGGARETRIPEE